MRDIPELSAKNNLKTTKGMKTMRIKIIALALSVALVLCLCGCSPKDNNSSSDAEVLDEFVIYHNSKALDSALSAAVRSYEKATGKKIGVKYAESGLLAAAEAEKPALYVVDAADDLSDWFNKGLIGDVSSLFGGVSVDPGLWLSASGSYGVPLVLEGYGYIFDRDMLADLFGVEDVTDLTDDLRACSYNDFMGFVSAVETYIAAPSAASVTVNGNEYTFAAAKTGKAQMLSGVFALTSESSRAYEYLMNYALAARFGGKNEISAAAENDIAAAKEAFAAAARAIDDLTSHIAGTGGSMGRGDDFVGGDYTYSAAIDAFTGGFALFYPGSTGDAADFKKSSVTFGKNLDILPMKLPIAEGGVTASGMSTEKLNRSIAIGSRYYLALNPNANAAAASAARDFVKWLYTDSAGMAAFSEAFGGVAFNYSGTAGLPENGTSMPNGSTSSDLSTEEGSSSTARGKTRTGSGNSSTESEASGTLDSILSTDDEAASTPDADLSTSGGSLSTESGAADTAGYVLSDSLSRAVARYYASGNWIPELVTAMPRAWRADAFGKSLTDYWNKPAWSDEDRENLVTGWINSWAK